MSIGLGAPEGAPTLNLRGLMNQFITALPVKQCNSPLSVLKDCNSFPLRAGGAYRLTLHIKHRNDTKDKLSPECYLQSEPVTFSGIMGVDIRHKIRKMSPLICGRILARSDIPLHYIEEDINVNTLNLPSEVDAYIAIGRGSENPDISGSIHIGSPPVLVPSTLLVAFKKTKSGFVLWKRIVMVYYEALRIAQELRNWSWLVVGLNDMFPHPWVKCLPWGKVKRGFIINADKTPIPPQVNPVETELINIIGDYFTNKIPGTIRINPGRTTKEEIRAYVFTQLLKGKTNTYL